MAKSSAEIQKEYNEVLKVSQSLTGALNDMVDDTAKSQKNLSDRAKEYNTNLKSIFSSAQEIESTEEAILKAEKLKGELSKRYFGANKKLLPQKEAEVDAGIDILKNEKKRLQLVKQVDDSQQKLTESINGSLDGLISGLDEIPVIGKAMSGIASGPVNYLKTSVSDAGKTFTNSFSAATKSGMTGMKAFASAGRASMGSLAASLAGPQAIIALIVAIAAAGVIAFYKVSAAAKSFRKETGLLNSQTGDLESKFANVTASVATMGGSIEDVSSAASTFSNQMKGTSEASEAVLTSMVAMEKSFGVSSDAQAKVNEQFQLMSGASAETAQNMIQTTIAAAEAAGVAPAAVMQDIAENAEAGMMFFQGSTKALAKAAIEARKMGTSIGETTKVAEGLLDFESSITKEMELGAMLGTRVNFNKARALAFEGDMIGMQKAVNAEVGKLGDINKMNMYQKKALSEATGMDLKSLIKQQQIAKKFKGIDDERLAAANSLMDSGMSIENITDSQLAKEAKRLGQQKSMQSEADKLSDSMGMMGKGIGDMFAPLATLLLPLFNDLVDIVNAQLMPVFSILGTVFRVTFGILGAVLKPLFAVFKAFSVAMMQPITRVAEAIRPIGEKFEELAPKIIKTLQPVISVISFIGNLIGDIVGFVIGGLVDGFIFAFDLIFGIFDSFYGFIQDYILSPIQSMLDLVQKGIDALASLNPFGGDDDLASDASQLQSGGSVDDGIVQNGKIISTHPEDTLIATKNPDSLFGESMFGKIMSATPLGMMANSVNDSTDGGISNVVGGIGDAMSGVGDMFGGLFGGDTKDADIVAKLDELLIVMRGNKDVYMDGKKLTAGVSNQSDKFAANSNALV